MEKKDLSEKEGRDAKKYLFWAFLLLLIVFSYFILKDYLIALISAFVLAYLIRPIHLKIEKRTGNGLAGFASIFLILAVIIIPFWFVFNALIDQAIYYF